MKFHIALVLKPLHNPATSRHLSFPAHIRCIFWTVGWNMSSSIDATMEARQALRQVVRPCQGKGVDGDGAAACRIKLDCPAPKEESALRFGPPDQSAALPIILKASPRLVTPSAALRIASACHVTMPSRSARDCISAIGALRLMSSAKFSVTVNTSAAASRPR